MQFVFDKEEWKQDAFTRIKQSLYYAKGNTVAGKYSNTQEEHLVVVYGITQVGKTTLILNMIGIQEQYFDTVYKTLRAGQPTGSSSTSTAIIYSISNSDKYKLAIRKMNAVDFSDMNEYDDNGLITHLKQIREDVESGRFDPADILYIAIPKKYFESDAKDSKISIIDLPGDHSKNCEEMVHVSNLLSRYIPIASTCIIATRSGWIEQLGALELPNKVSWKNMNHRFVIVVTHAYSDADTKSFFIKHKSHSKEDFYHFVQDRNESALRKILGCNNKTEIFPVELGDSLSTLCKEFDSTESVISAINFAKDTTLNQLRQSILNRKGQRLQAAIADLRVIIDTNCTAMIHQLSTAIKEQNDEIAKLRIEKNQSSVIIKDKQREYAQQRSESTLEIIDGKIARLKETDIEFDAASWWAAIDKYYKDSKWYTFFPGYHIRYTKRKDAFFYFYEYVCSKSEEFITNHLYNLIGKESVDDAIEEHRMQKGKDVFRVEQISSDTTPENMRKCMDELVEIIIKTLKDSIDLVVSDLIKERSEHSHKLQEIEDIISFSENELTAACDKIAQCQTRIKNFKHEISNLETKKQEDIRTLEQYLQIARQAYLDYRNKIINLINSNGTSPAEKIKLLLYVGILDKDYIKITGGTE